MRGLNASDAPADIRDVVGRVLPLVGQERFNPNPVDAPWVDMVVGLDTGIADGTTPIFWLLDFRVGTDV